MQKLKQKLILIAVTVLALGILSPMAPAFAATADCQDSSQAGLQQCLKTNPIVTRLNDIVAFLSAGIGIVIVGVIILGGIQYSAAGDNAEAVTKAKKRITDGLLALLGFLLIFAFLQWIVPGGVFNS